MVGLGGGFLLELGRELEAGRGGGALGEPDRSCGGTRLSEELEADRFPLPGGGGGAFDLGADGREEGGALEGSAGRDRPAEGPSDDDDPPLEDRMNLSEGESEADGEGGEGLNPEGEGGLFREEGFRDWVMEGRPDEGTLWADEMEPVEEGRKNICKIIFNLKILYTRSKKKVTSKFCELARV